MEFPEHSGNGLDALLTRKELYILAETRLAGLCKAHADSRTNSELLGMHLLSLIGVINALACNGKSLTSHESVRVIEFKAHQKFELEIGLQNVQDIVAAANGEMFMP